MHGSMRHLLIFATVTMFFIPMAAVGDGIPVYYKVETDEYHYTWETRQLAVVEYNGKTQELHLFLSVISLKPETNLSIVIPLKTLPTSVSAVQMKEFEFNDKYNIDKVEGKSKRQRWSSAMSKLRDDFKKSSRFVAFSALTSTVGALMDLKIISAESSVSRHKGEVGAQFAYEGGEPQPIQHYDFPGMTMDVYDINSNMTLKEYLEQFDDYISSAARGIIDDYSSDYVAILNARPRLPINDSEFEILRKYSPNTLMNFINYTQKNRKYSGIERIAYQYSHDATEEANEKELEDNTTLKDIHDAMYELVMTTYGKGEFEGHDLTIISPLYNENVYFPLGTGKSWENPIWETSVLFVFPENKKASFNDDARYECVMDGKHYYLFKYEGNNPSEDLLSKKISEFEHSERKNLENAELIYTHSNEISWIVVFLLFYTLCVVIIHFFCKRYKDDYSYRHLLYYSVIPILSITISIWLIFLIMHMNDKFTTEKIWKYICTTFLIISSFFLILGAGI